MYSFHPATTTFNVDADFSFRSSLTRLEERLTEKIRAEFESKDRSLFVRFGPQ